MTVYVDNARIPARAGRTTARWSHLTADTPDELHAFAARFGMRRVWYRQQCKRPCAPEGQSCPHWHYDVTDARRADAVRLGAVEIDLSQMGDLIRARRAAARQGGQP